MKVTSNIASEAGFQPVEHLAPGTLFKTKDGKFGVRIMDAYFVLSTARAAYCSVAKRNADGILPDLACQVLPHGTQITLTQD